MNITAMQRFVFTMVLVGSLSLNVYGSNKEKNHSKDKMNSKNEMAVLSGKAIDAQTGETLAGVAITLTGLNKTIYTDFEGNFTIENLHPGKYNVTANLITYKESTLEKFELQQSEENKVTFTLKSKY